MRRSQIAIFMMFIVAATTLVAADSSSTRATVRYRTDRFKAGGSPTAAEPVGKSATHSERQHRPSFVRQVQHSERAQVPPLPPTIKLAQADLLDDLLDTPRQDVIPESALNDAMQDAVPRTPETDNVPGTPPARGAPTPTLGGPPAGAAGRPVVLPRPEVKPMDPRQRIANQPYTLGGILDDEEDPNECLCEQLFCEQMWQCAGGRNVGWIGRWRRNSARNVRIWRGQANCLPNPMKNWECPYRQRGGLPGGPGCQPGSGGYDGLWNGRPPGSKPISDGGWSFSENDFGVVGPAGPLPQPAYLEMN